VTIQTKYRLNHKLIMKIDILSQPDDSSCGPTSLHAVYAYMGHKISLESLLEEVRSLSDGGTLAVLLGLDALKRGFKAEIHSYNLRIFDPTWHKLDRNSLVDKLQLQLVYKTGKKFTEATNAYIHFLKAGGILSFEDLTQDLLLKYFKINLPVLAGLNSNYLYKSAREYLKSDNKSICDDIKGEPQGHFVVLHGMTGKDKIMVADPYIKNPISETNYYQVDVNRLINAIHLGIVTYDANLLIISKRS